MADDILSRTLNIKAHFNLVADQNFKANAAAIGKMIADATRDNLVAQNTLDALKKKNSSSVNPETGEIAQPATADTKKDKATQSKQYEAAAKGTLTVAQSGVSILKNTFGILTDVANTLKKSSPLLQAVESLFNLAVQLFFMPLGTRLATVLIPKVITLVDSVMDIWDGFENKSLSEILTDMIEVGVSAFSKFFMDIGNELKDQKGIFGAIGTLLTDLGTFIEKHGENLITWTIKGITFILGKIPELLGIVGAFMIATKALQIAQIVTTAAIGPQTAIVGAAALAAATATAAGIGYGVYSSIVHAAEGGYFPATPGGTQVLLAEGGEGETVVPDSKKVDFAKAVMSSYTPQTRVDARVRSAPESGNVFNIYITGYTDTDLSDKIIRVINEQTNLSKLRSGF
jgi:hypothetical protein